MIIDVIISTHKHERRIWKFCLFNTRLVFRSYRIETKEPRQRKWRLGGMWCSASYEMRNLCEEQRLEEPKLESHIKQKAIQKLNSQISCITWSEYKNK
jgi:hypothetical protein